MALEGSPTPGEADNGKPVEMRGRKATTLLLTHRAMPVELPKLHPLGETMLSAFALFVVGRLLSKPVIEGLSNVLSKRIEERALTERARINADARVMIAMLNNQERASERSLPRSQKARDAGELTQPSP